MKIRQKIKDLKTHYAQDGLCMTSRGLRSSIIGFRHDGYADHRRIPIILRNRAIMPPLMPPTSVWRNGDLNAAEKYAESDTAGRASWREALKSWNQDELTAATRLMFLCIDAGGTVDYMRGVMAA